MSDKILTGELPGGGPVFACVDPSVRFCEARLDDSRLGASLTPFSTETAAREALTAAGATIKEDRRK